MPRLLVLAAWLSLAFGGVAAAAPLTWREAYQSSSADYDFVIPEGLKLPPETRERLRDRPPVTGTLRMRFAVAVAGGQVRLRFSNEEGTRPLRIAAASLGLVEEGFAARPGSLRRITFRGADHITVPPGAPALSDPVNLPVQVLSQLVVSMMVPDGLKLKPFGSALMAMASGDQTLAPTMAGADTIIGRPPVSGALVLSARPPRLIVALGDSITDGNRPALGQLHGWPERLEQRLAAGASRDRRAVLNAGIGGGRVLSTSWGKSALARFDRDVARIGGVSDVIVLEGINDIGNGGPSQLLGNNPPLDVDDLIAGYRQLIARAHAANIRVTMATLLPFAGSTSYTAERERQRAAVNTWIRTSREPDAVIDFEAVMRDPADPQRLRAPFDSGDHLHPNEAGYRAMGDAIDLGLFRDRS